MKADVYRYPSPGNAVNIPLAGEQYSDYKTPYEHSQYNIRYSKPTPSQKSDPIFEVRYDSPLLSPLVKYNWGKIDYGNQGYCKQANKTMWMLLQMPRKNTSKNLEFLSIKRVCDRLV